MSRSAFQNFTDPDTFQAAFHDMRAKSFITGRGNFRANFTTIQLDRLSLQGAEETLPRTAFSGLDPRKFAIGFATHPKGIFVTIQPVDGGPWLCRMRMLRLRGGP